MVQAPLRWLWLALVVWPLKALWMASVVLVPVLGVWVASSIAAYRNGPVWLACLCGLLLFPVLPLLWDLFGSWRRGRSKRSRPRILTLRDRLILRTLVLNLAVLAGLLAGFPRDTFTALSTRGDWFLDGRSGPQVEQARALLFRAADRIEWLFDAVHANPYDEVVRDEGEPSLPEPVPGASKVEASKVLPSTGPTPPPGPPSASVDAPAWPLPAQLHPLVVGMPAQAEASIEAVGRYIAEHEPDQRLRIKALHDYVADRVAYDAEAYADRRYPPQDAETVFKTRLAVCAGSAQLLAALGKAAGEEIVVVLGDARVQGSDVTGEGHAWNAARVADDWYLIDPTWDAGSVEGRTFTKRYSSSYLFAPPAVFTISHFPEEPRWQLQAPPVSRGDFFRAPMMRAEFHALGLTLLGPDRSQVSVDEVFEIAVDNPKGRFLLAKYVAPDGSTGRCAVDHGPRASARCELPAPGAYQVELYAAPEQYGSYPLVGSFAVNRGS
ncbi:MAG: transglutaminase [Nannocystis sp.]|nr:transglutaminase domain-containing protein [Nannocystis sp.]MBA3549158.1 transglutaminase [Nannocystis sp.]